MARAPASLTPPAAEEAAATHGRLIAAAGEIFSERGFEAATVREICARAGANVAAVNYHFGDKTELYLAVIRQSMCAAQEQLAGAGAPEETLAATIQAMLRKMRAGAEEPAWHFRIMAQEMVAPTPVFARVVDEVIGPQYAKLRGTIGRILGLGPDHEQTRLAANSIIGQVIFYANGRPVIERLWPGFRMDERMTARIARHIASFSLCSLHAIRNDIRRARRARAASKGRPQ